MQFDTRSASLASLMKVNGITTGKMDANAKENTPSAPRTSSLAIRG